MVKTASSLYHILLANSNKDRTSMVRFFIQHPDYKNSFYIHGNEW